MSSIVVVVLLLLLLPVQYHIEVLHIRTHISACKALHDGAGPHRVAVTLQSYDWTIIVDFQVHGWRKEEEHISILGPSYLIVNHRVQGHPLSCSW